MAPNISGVKVLDQSRWLNLAELALDFALSHMKVGGHLVVKCFEGVGSDEFKSQVQQYFKRTQRFKPKASRDRSSEFFFSWFEQNQVSVALSMLRKGLKYRLVKSI
jgi:23S rRNA (uridine2552-2'-O)-methyltransferase